MNLSYPTKLIAGFIAAVSTPLVVVGLCVLVAARLAALPDDAAMRVSGTVVTITDLKHRLQVLKALYGIAAPSDPQGQDAFRRQSAQAIAVGMVLRRAARDEGIVVEEKTAREALERMIVERFPGGRAGFVQLLRQVGASEQDVVDEIERQQATAQLADKVIPHQEAVSEADARRYYDQHGPRFVQPAARHLRNIVVASQNDANDVVNRLRSGTDFAALAKQFSLDQSTREAGGDLGYVSANELDAAYATAAFAAGTGVVYGPIKTAHGWNVGQVLEQRAPVRLAFDQIKDQLRGDLARRNAETSWRDWVTRRVKDAHVEYADLYRPRNPDAPLPAEPVAALDSLSRKPGAAQ